MTAGGPGGGRHDRCEERGPRLSPVKDRVIQRVVLGRDQAPALLPATGAQAASVAKMRA